MNNAFSYTLRNDPDTDKGILELPAVFKVNSPNYPIIPCAFRSFFSSRFFSTL
ncbi:unnamed protein product [Sphenostylis stenocarpa]|uniref:Uncharacterized protein n=1 Tax=Sphenostylis stenocarpa TaxID=92480 RepID=A0AA86VFP5_9FABA|nr:unnamed protein product [Sphenostylis stenocarpa]